MQILSTQETFTVKDINHINLIVRVYLVYTVVKYNTETLLS